MKTAQDHIDAVELLLDSGARDSAREYADSIPAHERCWAVEVRYPYEDEDDRVEPLSAALDILMDGHYAVTLREAEPDGD